MTTFAKQLQDAKVSMGFKYDHELAAFLDIDPSIMSRYLSGQRIPRIATVQEFAAKLGMPFTFGE